MTAEEWPAAEEWRAIEGYEDWYEVSNRGRVRSWKDRGARPVRRASEPQIMTLWAKEKGHLNIVFSHNGRSRARTIHQLVAEAFIGPRPEGMVTCHDDGDPANNVPSNLRYDTHAGNEADKQVHGTSGKGSLNSQSKLTDDAVREIRRRRAEGESKESLGAAFGIHPVHALAIVRRDRWSHVA